MSSTRTNPATAKQHPMIPVLTTTVILNAILKIAKEHPVVFAEQVWKELGVPFWYARSSKLGPAFQLAARRGYIERTNEVVYTKTTRTNAGRFLWRSKIYEGGRGW